MNDGCSNNNYNASGDTLSWIIVIICLVAFWPLGLFLLLKKISVNPKKKAYNNASQQRSNAQCASAQNTQSARQPYRPYQQQTRNAQQPRQPGQQQLGQPQQGQYSQEPRTAQAGPNNVAAGTHAQYYQAPAAQSYRYQPAKAYTAPAQNPGKAKKEKDQRKGAKRNTGKALSAFLLILGIIFSMLGLAFLSSGVSELVSSGFTAAVLWELIMGAFFSGGGLISFITRGFKLQHNRRLNKYLAIIGDREIIAVADMVGSCGVSAKTLRRDLQDMAEDGCFGPSAYFDIGLDSLVLSAEAAEKARTEASKTQKTPESEESGNQYMNILNELRDLEYKTADVSICEKIKKIEDLSAKIFRIVEDKPEKIPQIRRFMNYYLPTTIKLLNSYQTLEKQGINGENITSAKQDIERILDTLTSGYEQQLDNLFKSDKLDISADIDVLENMMEQDGLKNDSGNIMKPAGGN